MKLPADVREALVQVAMRWLLENYTGDRRKLKDYRTWSHRETYLCIGSGNLGANRPKTLRRLRMMVNWGFLTEPNRNTRNGTLASCRFYLPTAEQADDIYNEAQARHLAAGYILETMMDEIK